MCREWLQVKLLSDELAAAQMAGAEMAALAGAADERWGWWRVACLRTGLMSCSRSM